MQSVQNIETFPTGPLSVIGSHVVSPWSGPIFGAKVYIRFLIHTGSLLTELEINDRATYSMIAKVNAARYLKRTSLKARITVADQYVVRSNADWFPPIIFAQICSSLLILKAVEQWVINESSIHTDYVYFYWCHLYSCHEDYLKFKFKFKFEHVVREFKIGPKTRRFSKCNGLSFGQKSLEIVLRNT